MSAASSSRVRVLIPTGFGLNCEAETAHAFRLLGVEPDLVHLTDLFARRTAHRVPDYDILALIGGFAYGDHVSGGFVLATRIRAHLLADLRAFLAGGGLVLGICNGFQTLVRLGLLPGPDAGEPDFVARAALAPNDRLGYRDAWVRLGVDPKSRCAWTRGLTTLEMPARHGEGKLVFADDSTIERLSDRGAVALRYLDPSGEPTQEWPHNPNGTKGAIAGLTDATGRILGLMPHPDAFLHPWHHPRSRRDQEPRTRGEADGLAIFRAGLAAARER